MGDTKIPYVSKVWSITTGCQPDYECWERCWARGMSKRFPKAFGGDFTPRFHPERLNEPMRWKKPQLVFVSSMGDLFAEGISDEWIIKVFSAMATDILNPCKHTYLVLTKRAQRMAEFFAKHTSDGVRPWPNVYLGVTVENQADADERIPLLLHTPAAVRWISAEPLLGPVDLFHAKLRGCLYPRRCSACDEFRAENMIEGVYCMNCGHGVPQDKPTIDWVVAGAESGPYRRPAPWEWFRQLRDQCEKAGVSFFLKSLSDREDGSGRIIQMPYMDGRQWKEIPSPNGR